MIRRVLLSMPHRARGRGGSTRSLKKAEPKASYTISEGIRFVTPYVHSFTTFAKGRWLGRELLSVLMSEFGAHPEEYWRRAIERNFVTVSGQKVSTRYQFKNGDKLEHITHRHEPCVVGNIDFVGQNERILAVNKPSSIPVHPSGAYRFNSMLKILESEPVTLNQPEKLYLVHRLDRVTSGLVLLAKNSEAAKSVADEIQSGNTEKIYLARVKGKFPALLDSFKHKFEGKELLEVQYKEDREEEIQTGKGKKRKAGDVEEEGEGEGEELKDTPPPSLEEVRGHAKVGYGYDEDQHSGYLLLRCPLKVSSHKEGIHACNPEGKESLSGFKHLGYEEETDTSLVMCRPFTGRTHQLRLHLQLLGNPIANDPCYGGDLFYADSASLHKASLALARMRTLGIQPLSKVPHFTPVPVDEASIAPEKKTVAVVEQKKEEGEGDETLEAALVRSCRYCAVTWEKEAQELEAALHCKGIWLHALQYQGKSGAWSFTTKWPSWAETFESDQVTEEKRRGS